MLLWAYGPMGLWALILYICKQCCNWGPYLVFHGTMKYESQTIDFAGISLHNPVFTASGTCGYADELGDFMDIDTLGGFITKSISIKPRKGNPVPRIVETDAGMLNAIGLANMGVDQFSAEKIPILERMAASGV